MASVLKNFKTLKGTPGYRALELIIYAVMLILVLIYFTGNGEFIYEL